MILRAEGLALSYGSVRAVAGVDIGVGVGEIVGLLGPNGAGKSSVFGLLAGFLAPERGRVWLGETEVTKWPLHRRAREGLGYLPQQSSVFPRLTVRQNMNMLPKPSRRTTATVDSVLGEMGLLEFSKRKAGSLSGGERRRLEIARCMMLEPRVILLDEPFAGIDPSHVERLQQHVRRLADLRIGVLLTDHAVRETLATCDRAYLLDQGVVQMTGSPHEVASDEAARERYFGQEFRL